MFGISARKGEVEYKPSRQLDTVQDVFDYALHIAKHNKKECPKFFNWYVHHVMESNPGTKYDDVKVATKCAKDNLGYIAGYYNDKVRILIRDRYNALHPVFGDNYMICSHHAMCCGLLKSYGYKFPEYNSEQQ